jgi:glycyl-tRNA synthetase beta chain
MANKLLLEIGVEEIPANFMEGALSRLKISAEQRLTESRIDFKKIECLGTPRRMALLVSNISDKQKDLEEKIKGPIKNIAYDKKNKPTKILINFLKRINCKPEDVSIEAIGDNEYVFVKKFTKGARTCEVLKILPEIILSMTFPKSMRWGNYDIKFARPIRWLVALFNNEIINFSIEEVITSNFTKGHSTLSDYKVLLKNAEEYKDVLKKEKVIVDQKERRQTILKQINKLEKTLKVDIVIDNDLLNEVVYLLEYPTVFYGSFDKEFLTLPKHTIITPMKDHQRYFSVFRDNKIQPYFIGVRNGDKHSLQIVRKGNEKVLRARLKDVQFFYNEDLKVKLEDRVSKLKNIVYQAKLGTVLDKVKRVQSLSLKIGKELNFSNKNIQKLNRAAYLCKADLVTNMVNEFNELQGIMGEIYALENKEDIDVARAIRSHYLPRYSGDELPTDDLGIVISIADKIDSIVGSFGLGNKPKGSHDPFGLRRQAIGIINIIIKNSLRINLDDLFDTSINLFNGKNIANKKPLKTDLESFFWQRLKVIFSEDGFRYDLINSVLDTKLNNLWALKKKVIFLSSIAESNEFKKLSVALSRIYSLSRQTNNGMADVSLFENSWEKSLYKATEKSKKDITKESKEYNYNGIIRALNELANPINDFFDNVMVMTEDIKIRNNRLALLKDIELLSKELCNFDEIVFK